MISDFEMTPRAVETILFFITITSNYQVISTPLTEKILLRAYLSSRIGSSGTALNLKTLAFASLLSCDRMTRELSVFRLGSAASALSITSCFRRLIRKL